jgi:hypothetical protein
VNESRPQRFRIRMPYRGSEHIVVVSVSALQRGYLSVEMPDKSIVTIETSDLELLIKCGLAERIP